jgi:hypothetical protein
MNFFKFLVLARKIAGKNVDKPAKVWHSIGAHKKAHLNN